MTKVSVIIPTYNRAELLKRSIDSVLAQTHPDIEIVVVDDGSTDNTEEVVRSYGDKVRYIRQPNMGASTARNHGVLRSTGDYLMFLDSDDTIDPMAIEKLAGALDSNPDYGAAFCGWKTIKSNDDDISYSSLDHPSGDVFLEMCAQHFCLVHSALVRRACLARSGLFDAEMLQYEDIDFWARVAAHCRFLFVPDHLVNYYRGHEGLSWQPAKLEWSRDYILSKLRVFYLIGRLDDKGWKRVVRRIRENYSNNCAIIALCALEHGDYVRALKYSVLGFIYRPETIRRRGRLVPFLRALGELLISPFNRRSNASREDESSNNIPSG